MKLHPDKNVNSSKEKQEECEKEFKKVQEAYSLIGTQEDRKKYEMMSRLQRRQASYGGSAPMSSGGNPYSSEEIFQRFFDGGGNARSPFNSPYQQMPRRRSAFYVNGVDVSHLFDPTRFSNRAATNTSVDNTPKSIFVQHVTVPLHELYTGSERKEFHLEDSIFQRYRASFRGGTAKILALQGLIAAVPLFLRTNRPIVSLICFLATFHLNLPKPSRLSYITKLKAGWKGGTKLKFNNELGIGIVFVIREGKDERFERVGNDLKTKICIGTSKARKGCTLFIEPLGSTEMPIMVKLKRGEVSEDGHIVTVRNRGWPRPDGQKGDLLIEVSIISDARASRRKQKNERKKRRSRNS